MKKLGLLFSFILAGCQLKTPNFDVPNTISFQQQEYVQVTHNQIDEMQQMLYLPKLSDKNPDKWQQGILIFLDKNSQAKTLDERLALRQQSFARQAETKAKLRIVGQELQSEVIYPPTERFNDVQLEVSRGRNLACGFGQMQFSQKQAVSYKTPQNLTAYQQDLASLVQQFAKLPWLIGCR